MPTLDTWLSSYSESHQNPVNKLIHTVCVPVIFFVVVALAWKILPLLTIAGAAAFAGFYYLLNPKLAAVGAGMVAACIVLQLVFGFGFIFLLVLFALAWAGQLYGYHLEGKKPSFLDNLKFLLIGPLWVVKPLLGMLGIKTAV